MTEHKIGYDDLIDNYYQKSDKNRIDLGQLAHTPISYREPLNIRPWDFKPGSGTFNKLIIVPNTDYLDNDDKLYRRKESFKMPLLETNEEYIAYRHKKRYTILLGVYKSINIRPSITYNTFYLCIPLYTTRDIKGKYKTGITLEQITNVKLLKYRNLLVIPKSKTYAIEECYIDFDRIQIIEKKQMDIKPTRISDIFLSLIINRFSYYTSNYMLSDDDDDLAGLWKELMLETSKI